MAALSLMDSSNRRRRKKLNESLGNADRYAHQLTNVKLQYLSVQLFGKIWLTIYIKSKIFSFSS